MIASTDTEASACYGAVDIVGTLCARYLLESDSRSTKVLRQLSSTAQCGLVTILTSSTASASLNLKSAMFVPSSSPCPSLIHVSHHSRHPQATTTVLSVPSHASEADSISTSGLNVPHALSHLPLSSSYSLSASPAHGTSSFTAICKFVKYSIPSEYFACAG